jgi:hypothetical protein
MARRIGRPRRDDLFAIFPDLPSLAPRSREAQVARIRRLMLSTRERAAASIERQRHATASVRARVAAARRRR